MNFKKINQDLVKAVFDGTKWGKKFVGYWVNPDYLLVTTDGFVAYILPKDKIAVSLAGLQELPDQLFSLEEMYKSGNEIKGTNEYIKGDSGRFLRRFKGENGCIKWSVYLDERFLKPVGKESRLVFTQEFSRQKLMTNAPVLVSKETDGDRIPLLFVCPVRVYDDID